MTWKKSTATHMDLSAGKLIVPSGCVVGSIGIANGTGSAITCSGIDLWNKGATTPVRELFNTPVPAGGYVRIVEEPTTFSGGVFLKTSATSGLIVANVLRNFGPAGSGEE